MDRRKFLKNSCSACLLMGSGLLFATLIEGCSTPMNIVKANAENDKVKVPLSDFQESNLKIVRVHGFDYDIAVKKHTDGSYLALLLMCTHAGNPLTETGNTYYCSLHGSKFDSEGHVLKGPAEQDLQHLPIKTEGQFLTITLQSRS